jgi:hypothetical protein
MEAQNAHMTKSSGEPEVVAPVKAAVIAAPTVQAAP